MPQLHWAQVWQEIIRGRRTESRASDQIKDAAIGRCSEHSGGVFFGEFLRFGGMVHGTKLRPTHGTEGRFLEAFFGKGFVVISAGGLRIERKIELAVPIEGIASAR